MGNLGVSPSDSLHVWFSCQKNAMGTVWGSDLTTSHSSRHRSLRVYKTESSIPKSPYPGSLLWCSSTHAQIMHCVFDQETTVQPSCYPFSGNSQTFQRLTPGFFSSVFGYKDSTESMKKRSSYQPRTPPIFTLFPQGIKSTLSSVVRNLDICLYLFKYVCGEWKENVGSPLPCAFLHVLYHLHTRAGTR